MTGACLWIKINELIEKIVYCRRQPVAVRRVNPAEENANELLSLFVYVQGGFFQ